MEDIACGYGNMDMIEDGSAKTVLVSATEWCPPWTRKEDNRLRELESQRDDGNQLPQSDEAELNDLSSRFQRFINHGLKSMVKLPGQAVQDTSQMLLVQRRLNWDLMVHLITGKQYVGLNACTSAITILELFRNEIQICQSGSDLESELHARVGVRRLGGLKKALRACNYILEDISDITFNKIETKLPHLSATVSSRWAIPFPEELTTDQPFLRPKPLTCQMMHTRGTFLYYEKPGEYKVCGLPTWKSAVDILVVLPEHGSGRQTIDIVEMLAAGEYVELTENLRRSEGDVYLPKFETTTPTMKLAPLLEACGCPSVIGNYNNDDLCFSIDIKIDENGLNSDTPNECFFSEDTLPLAVIGGKRFKLRLNKPFLLITRHKATNAIVQCAVIDNPTPVKDNINKNKSTSASENAADLLFSDPIQSDGTNPAVEKLENFNSIMSKRASVHSVFDIAGKTKDVKDVLAGFLEVNEYSADPVIARRRGKKTQKDDTINKSTISSGSSSDYEDSEPEGESLTEKTKTSSAFNLIDSCEVTKSKKSAFSLQDASSSFELKTTGKSAFSLEDCSNELERRPSFDLKATPQSKSKEPRQRISTAFDISTSSQELNINKGSSEPRQRVSSVFDTPVTPDPTCKSDSEPRQRISSAFNLSDANTVPVAESSRRQSSHPPVTPDPTCKSDSEPRQRISSAFNLTDANSDPVAESGQRPPVTSEPTTDSSKRSSAFNLPENDSELSSKKAIPTEVNGEASLFSFVNNSSVTPQNNMRPNQSASSPPPAPSPNVADLDAVWVLFIFKKWECCLSCSCLFLF